MIQFYLLSVVFLVLSAGLLLTDRFGTHLLFLMNMKTYYSSRKLVQTVWIVIGLVIATAIVFFPIDPGPIILGDLLPAATIVLVVLHFIRRLGKTDSVEDFNNGKRNALGYFALGVSLVHFLFPWVVVV